MSSSSLQNLMGQEQGTDRARSTTSRGRGWLSSDHSQPSWESQAMYNQVVQQQQQAQQQQKFVQQDTESRCMIIDPSSGTVVGSTNAAAAHPDRNHVHTAAPAARTASIDVQEKERLAVAASSGLYAPYNFPAPQKRVSSAIFSSELMNSPYFSVDEAMSSGSGSILAFPAVAPNTMDPATAAAAMQEGLASGIDDYHLLLLAQAAGLMDESGNLLPAYGGHGGSNRPGPVLPTIHSGTGISQESLAAGNGQFNSQEALAAFLHQQQMTNNRSSQPDQRWFGVEWNDNGNGHLPSNTNQTSSSNHESFNAPVHATGNHPSNLHPPNNQATWPQGNASHSSAGQSAYRSEPPTIEALSAEIAALLTLPGTSMSQINSLQALLMGNAGGVGGSSTHNVAAAQRLQFAPKVPTGTQSNSNWLRGGDDSAGGGYGSDGMQGYLNAGVATDAWLHPLSGSNGGSRLSGLRRTSGGGEDSAPGSPGPARNAVVNNSPWSGTLAGLNGDAFTSGMGSPSVPGRQHSLYKTELCRSWDESGSCRYGSKCQFAHGREELRPVQRHGKPKPEGCRAFAMTGSCPYGSRCRFVHNPLPSMIPRAQGRSNSLDTGLQGASMSDSSSAAQTFRRSLDALIGRHTQQQSNYNTNMLQALRNDVNAFPSGMAPSSTSNLLPSPLMPSSLAHLLPAGLPPIPPMMARGQSLDLNQNMRGQSLDLNPSEIPAWQHSLVAAMGGLQMASSRLGMEGLSLSESQMRGPALATVLEPETFMTRTSAAESCFSPSAGLSSQL